MVRCGTPPPLELWPPHWSPIWLVPEPPLPGCFFRVSVYIRVYVRAECLSFPERGCCFRRGACRPAGSRTPRPGWVAVSSGSLIWRHRAPTNQTGRRTAPSHTWLAPGRWTGTRDCLYTRRSGQLEKSRRLIRSGAQQNFAHTFMLTFLTDLPTQIFKLVSN